MNFLTIDPVQVRAGYGEKTYNLVGFPPLPFDFTYLYYEPATNLARKVVSVDGVLVYEDLSEAEIAVIEETIANESLMEQFKKVYETFSEEVVESEPADVGHCVDSTGKYQGFCEVTQGLTKVSSMPPNSKFDDFCGVVQRWDFSANKWAIFGGYSEKRKAEYLQQVQIGEQLGALVSAVDALFKGEAAPIEFTEIVSKIQAIKASIPKE